MLRIAICEDEEKYLELEKNIVSTYLKQKGLSFSVTGFSACESLLEDKVQLDIFDLIILDVEMKGINGIAAAKMIREKNDEVQIAFISAHMNYSTDGYHVRAIRYILKNKDDLEKYLQECLDRVLETIDQSERELTFDFTIGKRTLKVSDVVFLRSSGNYTVFEVSFESKETYLLRSTLKKMTELMHAFDFVSVSSKETVNLCHIKSMSRYSIVLDNGKVISISQKKYNDVYRTYTLYRGKNI
ncbi:MAG: response regulator transcription factor [Clostridiales bacterium]|nr:response regulator transcription factor [Clostridiales bacterium]